MNLSHVAEDDVSDPVSIWQRKCLIVVTCLASLVAVLWTWLFGDGCSGDILEFAGLGVLGAMVPGASARRSIERISPGIPKEALLDHIKEILWISLKALNAKSLLLTLWNQQTGERIEWKIKSGARLSIQVSSSSPVNLLPVFPDVYAAMFVRGEQGMTNMGVNGSDRPIESASLLKLLPGIWSKPFQVLMLGWFQLGEPWRGSVVYLDATLSACPEEDWNTWQHIVHAIRTSAALLDKDDAAARAEERKQLAHDLHDGVTQSIIATEMQLAVLARETVAAGNHSSAVLNAARDILRDEVRKLRKKIEELESGVILTPLQKSMRQLLRELEQKTGMSATLKCEMGQERIPQNLVCEVSYLLQAALSNIRRHSGASCVDVCLRVADGIYLDIQDNGCGCNFSGRYDLAALTEMKVGPRTICKRVEANGGRMIFESIRGSGVRLEVWLPLAMPEKGLASLPGEVLRAAGRKPPCSLSGPRNLGRAS